MKTRLNLWKAGFLTLLVIAAFLVGGCDKSPTSTANKSGNQPPAPIQAGAFHGQVYKSFDQRKVLTLISKDECELNEHGTILLCKYTKQNDNLRVVTTALGTSQVLYYRFTNQGLQDNDGNVLFSPEGLLEAQRQAELAMRAQQEAQAAAERQQAERQRLAALAAQREAEAERIAQAKQAESNRIARERQQEAHRAALAGQEMFKRGFYPQGVNEYEKAAELGDVRALNNLAWHFATCKDPTQHNGKRAVELALQATKGEPEAHLLGTLAAAYARNGQFEQAITLKFALCLWTKPAAARND